MSMSQTF